MKMFTAVVAGVLTLSIPNTANAEGDASTASNSNSLTLAQQIIETAYPDEVREPMFMAVSNQMQDQMMAAVRQQFSDIPPAALDVIATWQAEFSEEQKTTLREHIPLLMDAYAISYAHLFSEAELRDILAFVQTETGRTFMVRSTDVIADPAFAAANQAYLDETMHQMRQAMPTLIERMRELRETSTQK